MSADRLEARYRRLLNVTWSAPHVERYGEEMITVLMTDSADGQRRPGLRETTDLVLSGLRARLRLTAQGAFTPASRLALTMFGILAATVAAVFSYSQLATVLNPAAGFSGPPSPFAAATALGWTAVAVCATVRLRRVAALGAMLGAVGEVTHAALGYSFAPNLFVESWWRSVLVVTAAGCLALGARAGSRSTDETEPGTDPAPHRRTASGWHLLIAGAVSLVLGYAGLMLMGLSTSTMTVAVPLILPFAVPVLRLAPSARRRVVLLAAPSVASVLLVATTFGGFLASSPRFPIPVHLVAPQWIGLFATPVVVFAVGLWALRRHERQLASGALLA